MGYGMGAALRGVGEGLDDANRRSREEAQQKRDETTFQQQQDDRGFGLNYQRKAIQRQDELGDLQTEIARNDAEISRTVHGAKTEAAQAEAFGKVAELEQKNYGIVYNTYRTQGGKAAADLFNRMKGNDVSGAADFLTEKDPKTGKVKLKIVDAEGKVVSDATHGPAEFDVDVLEKMYPLSKGKFSESERGILNESTGDFKAHPDGLRKKDTPSADEKKYRELLALGVPDKISRGVAYGTIRQVQNNDGTVQALVDVTTNQTLGTLQDVGDKPLWKPSPGFADAGAPVPDEGQIKKARIDARKQAEKEAKKKSGTFRSDEEDFGMPRENWINQRADEILNEMATVPGPAAPVTPTAPAAPSNTPPAASSLPKGVSKASALAQAKSKWASASPVQKQEIRKRLSGWGISEADLKASGM